MTMPGLEECPIPEAGGPDAPPDDGSARGVIARQLAFSFGFIAILSSALCGLQCVLVHDSGRLVLRMREMESEVQAGYVVAAAVREQYMHQAHWIIERNDVHLRYSKEAARRAEEGIRLLAQRSEPGKRTELESLANDSRELSRIFSEVIAPAVIANDLESVKQYHVDLNRHSGKLMAKADQVAAMIEERMTGMHRTALDTNRWGMAVTVACIVSVLLFSCVFVVRLRQAVVRPVVELADAARSMALGRFHVRVSERGKGELGALARAFNRMAEELSTREARLIQGERMAAIGQLATGVAHEINNPIGIIRGYLKTMSETSPPEQLRTEIRILDEEAAACERLANDLLDFSRASQLHVSEVDMSRLLAETVERFLGTEEARGHRITTNVRAGTIEADPGRIRQVILNLLKNAVQVSSTNSAVEVAGNPIPGGGYVFDVADRGPGISAEDMGRVFEPFFSRNPKGSGLGLAVCQGIIRAHEGTIAILPRDGGGTIVTVRLPARRTAPRSAP